MGAEEILKLHKFECQLIVWYLVVQIVPPRLRNAPNKVHPVVAGETATVLVCPLTSGVRAHIRTPPSENKTVLLGRFWPKLEIPFT